MTCSAYRVVFQSCYRRSNRIDRISIIILQFFLKCCALLYSVVISFLEMLTRSPVIKPANYCCLSVKTALRCCFVLLLFVAFFISRFSAFARSSPLSITVKDASHTQEINFLAGSYFTTDHPAEPSPAEQEMEFIEEDETEKNTIEYFGEWATRYSSRELCYATFLKCRLSHVNSLLHNRPLIHFFVLYHSWKGYLS